MIGTWGLGFISAAYHKHNVQEFKVSHRIRDLWFRKFRVNRCAGLGFRV